MNRTWLVLIMAVIAQLGSQAQALEPTPQEHEYARRLGSLPAEADKPEVAADLKAKYAAWAERVGV